MFGTVEIDGVGIYYCFAKQSRTRTIWALTERDILDAESKDSRDASVVAIFRSNASGRAEGKGKVYLISRMLDNLNTVMGLASSSNAVEAGTFQTTCEWKDGSGERMLSFRTAPGSKQYLDLSFVYEGFKLDVHQYGRAFPFRVPSKLTPIEDERSKAAVIAGLGVKSFAVLRRQRGHDLDFYYEKQYKAICTDEDFRAMMLSYLRDVQESCNNGTAVLTGIDTETTGLNMLDLKPENSERDHIVAIPFSWKDDAAYVICTDMHYFGNVSESEVYPLFDKLFSRNIDFSYQNIDIDYCGEHFTLNRRNIITVGANVGFDEQAFLTHGASVFFDEDIQMMHYNLATDWVQGKNSLKSMTHRYLGVQTLELEDLFGPQHKDKYRYLSDLDLALVYGGADADFTRLLWKYLKKIMPSNLYTLYKKYDIPLRWMTAKATWQGMPIDEKAVREEGRLVLQDLETLKEFVYRYAYAANRKFLAERSHKLCELLGVDPDSSVEELGAEEKMYRYPFTPARHKNLLFGILGYPVIKVSEKSQEPALDKFVLKKLAERQREEPVEFLTEDIPSAADPDNPLIKKSDFNSAMYPLAQVFLKYAEINKEYTAYYKPIMSKDLESRMFYNFSLQRAATRRILSPGQTIKGSLKKLVIAPPSKLFMCFDASQIEYRHMASLAYKQTKALLQSKYPDDWESRLEEAGITRIFKMMQRKEADYHIETASMMTGLPQHQVSPAERKRYKSIGFGIPYGLGNRAMCEALFDKVTPHNLEETVKLLDDYRNRQSEIIRLLESARDSAFVPAPISEGMRKMLDIGDTHVGIVRNFVGFYRLFILEQLTKARTARVRRQAGNCLIQGGAAELYRRMLYGFHQGCVEAGIAEKVQWLMLVHDELDSLVDADIDVCKLLDVLQTNCTLHYEDQIPYYIGIGFGPNWYDAKDDAAELPVIMVDRIIERYRAGKFSIPCDGNQAENLLALKRHYLCDRVGEVLSEIIPNIGPGFAWSDKAVDAVDKQFTNYVVRSYLGVFATKEDKACAAEKARMAGKNPKKAQVPLNVLLDRWLEARNQYGFGCDFLQHKLPDAREEIATMILDATDDDITLDLNLDSDLDDLRIELLENSDEEQLLEQKDGSWFGETSLFDANVASEDLVVDTEEGYKFYKNDQEEAEDYKINENPSNAFDVFVSSKYSRKHVVCSGEGVYSVLLAGTSFNNQVGKISNLIRSQFEAGNETVLLIGSGIKKVSSVKCDDASLDTLDKLLCGGEKT